jgi:dTMP kinase
LLTLSKSYDKFWGYMPFFTFEGIDGSGKSHLIKSFAEHLKSRRLTVEITREPGGSELGQELRQMILRTGGTPPCPEAELLLYEADRAQHVATKIRPWLEKNVWVLSDRFGDSSVAFQGAGRHISKDKVSWLNEFATKGLVPDLTVIVDCPVEISTERRKKRELQDHTKPDRMEQEREAFHQAVRDEYLKMAKGEKRFFVLDGTQSPEALLKQLISECEKRKIL